MYYNVMKAKDIVDVENGQFTRKPLIEKDESSFNIIAIKKDAIIDTHTSSADAAVYVIDGEIEIHFDAQNFKISKGEVLMFKKDTQHKVVAIKDSKFFLIKI